MKNKHKKILAGLVASILPILSVSAGQMPDSSGSGAYVKTISIDAINPHPAFIVKSDGEKYTHVTDTDKKKTFNARVTGVCRSLRWVHSASYNLSTTKYGGSNVAHNSLYEPGQSKKHKTFGVNKWVNIQWKPSSKLNDLALKTCKNHMKSEKAKGKKLADILGKEKRIVVDSGIWGSFHLNCAAPIGGGVKHRFDMQPMEVICQGSTVKAQVKPERAKLFKLTKMAFGALKKNYQGTCPVKFKFVGYVKTNGQSGKFRYRFRDQDGKRTGWKTVNMSKGKTHYGINHMITLQDQKTPQQGIGNKILNKGNQPMQQLGMLENPYVKMEVENLVNKKKYDRKATYRYKCKTPAKLKLGKINTPGVMNGKADLVVLAPTFRLGNVVAGGNHSITIHSNQATGNSGNKCHFRMQVSLKNQGAATAEPLFRTRLKRNNAANLLSRQTSKILKGGTKKVSGTIKLPKGKSTIVIHTDYTDKVDESKENNNMSRVMVNVTGSCGNTPARPPRQNNGNGRQ